VHAAEEPDGRPDERRGHEELHAADDGVGHPAAGLADGRGQVGEEAERERRSSLVRDVPQEEEEHAQGTGGRDDGRAEHPSLDQEPAAVRAPRHAVALWPVRMPAIISRASAFTTMVMPNSTRAISISAEM